MVTVVLKRDGKPYWSEEFASLEQAKMWVSDTQSKEAWDNTCSFDLIDTTQADEQKQAAVEEAIKVKQDLKNDLLKQIQSYRDTDKKDLEILSAMANALADFILLGG